MRRRATQLIGSAGLFVLIGVLGGCDESPTGPSLNEDFTVAPGEITAIAEAGVRVRFDRVEGDSRCPADAVCVQGGDALVRITVIERSTERPYELHTGSMEPVTHDGADDCARAAAALSVQLADHRARGLSRHAARHAIAPDRGEPEHPG